MKSAWNYVTLMRHCHPGDDYKVTPLRFIGGLAFVVVLVFGSALFGFSAGMK